MLFKSRKAKTVSNERHGHKYKITSSVYSFVAKVEALQVIINVAAVIQPKQHKPLFYLLRKFKSLQCNLYSF